VSKIIQAINVMISNSDRITEVYSNNRELYFLYDGKHKWSILQRANDEGVSLFYYPAKTIQSSVRELSSMSAYEFNQMEGKYIMYTDNEFKTREALESFSELYRIVKEKLLDVDTALADIIDNDVPF